MQTQIFSKRSFLTLYIEYATDYLILFLDLPGRSSQEKLKFFVIINMDAKNGSWPPARSDFVNIHFSVNPFKVTNIVFSVVVSAECLKGLPQVTTYLVLNLIK